MKTRPLPPHLKRWYDKRTGKTYLQFRKRGHKTVPLPQPIGTDEFWIAYNAALKGKVQIGTERNIPGSVSAALAAYYISTDWSDGLEASTRAAYRPLLERLREAYGRWPLRQITANFISAYIEGLRPHAARKQLKALRGFLRHARHDVTASISPPSSKTKKHASWPADVMAQYEAHHAIGSKARLCFGLAKYTGAARVDLPRLGPKDVVDGVITITRRKTGVTAFIPVHPELRVILDATPVTGLATFLVNSVGTAYAPNDLSIQFRKWCDEAGIPPQYTLHGLRHTMGDTIATLGGSLHEVAATLGHRDVRTAAHYTQEADRKRLSRQAMRRMIDGAKQDNSGNTGVSVDRSIQTQRRENT